MTDFTKILNTTMATIEKPKPLPEGTYQMTVMGKSMLESKQKGTPGLEIICRIDAPMEDVDQDLLEKVNWQGREMRTTLWLTDNSLYRVVSFLKACGIDTEEGSIGEGIENVDGRSVAGKVVQEISGKFDEDGDAIIYTNISKYLPVE